MNTNMKQKALLLSSLLGLGLTSVASAATLSVTDNGTSIYTSAQGFAIDFTSAAPNNSSLTTGWSPTLLAGTTYILSSISPQLSGVVENGTGNFYLGVYTGLSGGNLTGFLGTSTNTVNFASVTAGSFQQYDFSGINVTADAAADGAGTGLLHFIFQSGTTGLASLNASSDSVGVYRSGPSSPFATGYSAIIAGTNLVGNRAPNYTAVVAVPEPSTAILGGLGVLGLMLRRRR